MKVFHFLKIVYIIRIKRLFDVMNLGLKIIKARKEKGLSQRKLAEKIGVTFQTVSKWELNKSLPDIEKVKKLSEILEKDIYYFVED